MSVLLNLNPTATTLSGGTTAANGVGEDWKITGGGTWTKGDTLTITLTDSQTGNVTQVGAGNLTGINPTFCFTYNDKVYLLAGSTTYFSAVESPTVFNDPSAAGNGFITMSNWYSTQEPLTAISVFQGKLLFASRRTTQIWSVDPDPANYSQSQVLPNIGTIAPESVQAVGDMDVYMLADNGVRSVRVRVASDNAIIADVGTPIDILIKAILSTLTDAQIATSCGIVDPSSNRYWLYIPNADGSSGLTWVFSSFPNSNIAAWSTYQTTVETDLGHPLNTGDYVYSGLIIGASYFWLKGQSLVFQSGSTTLGASGSFVADSTTATVVTGTFGENLSSNLTQRNSFVPQKFCVFQGQVWVRDTNGLIYQFGGSNNNTYTNCGIFGITPFSDGGKAVAQKTYTALDVALEGTWQIGQSPDYQLQKYIPIYTNNVSSFKLESIPISNTATHYSLSLTEFGSGYARLSAAYIHQMNVGDK